MYTLQKGINFENLCIRLKALLKQAKNSTKSHTENQNVIGTHCRYLGTAVKIQIHPSVLLKASANEKQILNKAKKDRG